MRIEVPDAGSDVEDEAALFARMTRSNLLETAGIVSDDRLDGERRNLGLQPDLGFRQGGFGDVDRIVKSAPLVVHGGLKQQPGLCRRSGAELKETQAPPSRRQTDHLFSITGKEFPFRPREVILRQAANLFEKARASSIVEKPGRKSFGRPREAAIHFSAHWSERGIGKVADCCGSHREALRLRKRDERIESGSTEELQSSANRIPENCQRVSGEKKLRYEERMWEVGVTTDPPRNTIWLDMNFPLYSPRAPSAGRKPG